MKCPSSVLQRSLSRWPCPRVWRRLAHLCAPAHRGSQCASAALLRTRRVSAGLGRLAPAGREGSREADAFQTLRGHFLATFYHLTVFCRYHSCWHHLSCPFTYLFSILLQQLLIPSISPESFCHPLVRWTHFLSPTQVFTSRCGAGHPGQWLLLPLFSLLSSLAVPCRPPEQLRAAPFPLPRGGGRGNPIRLTPASRWGGARASAAPSACSRLSAAGSSGSQSPLPSTLPRSAAAGLRPPARRTG